MFCPNCGEKNNKKQNYCRYCGLNLQDTAKSLANQLVFGEESKTLKKLSLVKRTVDITSIALIGAFIVSVIIFFFIDPAISKKLIKFNFATFFLIQILRQIIGYFQRIEAEKATTKRIKQNEIETKDTDKLLMEKPFEPVPTIIENSTELLYIENKTRKF